MKFTTCSERTFLILSPLNANFDEPRRTYTDFEPDRKAGYMLVIICICCFFGEVQETLSLGSTPPASTIKLNKINKLCSLVSPCVIAFIYAAFEGLLDGNPCQVLFLHFPANQ